MSSYSDGRTAAGGGRVLHVGSYALDLDDSLGKGSFAEVFKGKHVHTGQEVAIKRIHHNRVKGASNQKLLDSEISIMQEVKHVNIVALLGHFRTGAHIYLVMEFCNGGDLNDFILKHFPMSGGTIAYIASHIASAMHYLHQHHIVHRDLKPQNILVHYPARSETTNTGEDTSVRHTEDVKAGQDRRRGDPIIKIADFGFARHLEADLAETFCGSPLYMAPEVLFGGAYDSRSDLWSVGSILYQCVTKRPPFRAKSIEALKTMLRKKTAEDIKFPPETPEALCDLLRGLLRVSPENRLSFEDLFTHPFLNVQRAPAVYETSDGNILLKSNTSSTASSEAGAIEEKKTTTDPSYSSGNQSSTTRQADGRCAVPYGSAPVSPSPGASLFEEVSDGSDPPSLVHVSDTATASPLLPRLLHTAMQYVQPLRPGGHLREALTKGVNKMSTGTYDAMAPGSSTYGGSDYSFIVVDKEHVEINTLADDFEEQGTSYGRVYRGDAGGDDHNNGDILQPGPSGGATSVSKQDAEAFVTAIQRSIRPASAIMLVAQHHLQSDRVDPATGMAASVIPVGMGGRPARAVLRIEALKLYNKALTMLRSGMADLRTRIEANAQLARVPKAKSAVQALRKRFNDCLTAVEQLRRELPDTMEMSTYLGETVVGPEELLYTYALDLCREAVDWETKGDLVRSELLYSRILVLFNILLQTAEANDARILEEYAEITRRRLDAVLHRDESRTTQEQTPPAHGMDNVAAVTHAQHGGDHGTATTNVAPMYPALHHGRGSTRDHRAGHASHALYTGFARNEAGFSEQRVPAHALGNQSGAGDTRGDPTRHQHHAPSQHHVLTDDLAALEAQRSRLEQRRAMLHQQLADVDATLQQHLDPQQRQHVEQDRVRLCTSLEDCRAEEDYLQQRARDQQHRLRVGEVEYGRVARDTSTSTSGSSTGSMGGGGASYHDGTEVSSHRRSEAADQPMPPPHDYRSRNQHTHGEHAAQYAGGHPHGPHGEPANVRHQGVASPAPGTLTHGSPTTVEQHGGPDRGLRHARRLSPPSLQRLSPTIPSHSALQQTRPPTIREEAHEGMYTNRHPGATAHEASAATTRIPSDPIAIAHQRPGAYDEYDAHSHHRSDRRSDLYSAARDYHGSHSNSYEDNYLSAFDTGTRPAAQGTEWHAPSGTSTGQASHGASRKHPYYQSGYQEQQTSGSNHRQYGGNAAFEHPGHAQSTAEGPYRQAHVHSSQRGLSDASHDVYAMHGSARKDAAQQYHASSHRVDAANQHRTSPRQSPPQGAASSHPQYSRSPHGSPPASQHPHAYAPRHSPPQQHTVARSGTTPPTGEAVTHLSRDVTHRDHTVPTLDLFDNSTQHTTTGAFVDHTGVPPPQERPMDVSDGAARIPRTSPLRNEGLVPTSRRYPDAPVAYGGSVGSTQSPPTSVGFSPASHRTQQEVSYGESYRGPRPTYDVYPSDAVSTQREQLRYTDAPHTEDSHGGSRERRASLPESHPSQEYQHTGLSASQETSSQIHHHQQHFQYQPHQYYQQHEHQSQQQDQQYRHQQRHP
eukprot:m.1215404 g.1215404  ORF g.1215404 m.1215404 type:complete len:1546 (+) comp24609_c0_seq1:536-5173(+)